jgi:hypothetical protein
MLVGSANHRLTPDQQDVRQKPLSSTPPEPITTRQPRLLPRPLLKRPTPKGIPNLIDLISDCPC